MTESSAMLLTSAIHRVAITALAAFGGSWAFDLYLRQRYIPNLSPEELRQRLNGATMDGEKPPYEPEYIHEDYQAVESPYGTLQVYEWGPEDGRKVLFIPGISTPCIAFKGMAERLVNAGYRVMLFGAL
jgi:hypothetical protein